jgi:aminopeptidase N
MGLLDAAGRDLPLQLAGEAEPAGFTRVLELTQPSQTFTFVNVTTRPVLSIGRGFSAPVLLDCRYDDEELALLARRDSDLFNRWEALQRLLLAQLLRATDAFEFGQQPRLEPMLPEVCADVLADDAAAPALRYEALSLPAEVYVAEQRALIDAQALRRARMWLGAELGRQLAPQWRATYERQSVSEPYTYHPTSAGRRALRNLALGYLVEGSIDGAIDLARAQLDQADNMTDRQAALGVIVNSPAAAKAEILVGLARDWADEPLLMNKWFQLQATAVAHPREVPVLERVKVLTRHKSYSATNPNNVYALVLAFCSMNLAEFHRGDGAGYAFWTDQVLQLDRHNPTVAARLARALENWRRYVPRLQGQMRTALEQVAGRTSLSRDVREIVTKSLAPA